MNFRRRDTELTPRLFGNNREAVLAKNGYRRTPGSGSSSVKGDFRKGDFMIELKSTRKDSFRVDANVMAKLKNDGLTTAYKGVLVVEIGTGDKFAVMPLKTFEGLMDDGD